MARNAYDRAMRDIYRKVERARKDGAYMEQLLRENAMQAKNINRRMARIEKAMGTEPGAVKRARESAQELFGMDQFSRGKEIFRKDPDKLLDQLQAMARFDLAKSSTVKGAIEYREEALKNLDDKGFLTGPLRESAQKQNTLFDILSSKSLYGFEDYMASEEYIEMIVDAVDKGATKEKFEAAIEKMLKKNERRPDDRKLDIDEIFEAALKESYKPVKKRRNSKKT